MLCGGAESGGLRVIAGSVLVGGELRKGGGAVIALKKHASPLLGFAGFGAGPTSNEPAVPARARERGLAGPGVPGPGDCDSIWQHVQKCHGGKGKGTAGERKRGGSLTVNRVVPGTSEPPHRPHRSILPPTAAPHKPRRAAASSPPSGRRRPATTPKRPRRRPSRRRCRPVAMLMAVSAGRTRRVWSMVKGRRWPPGCASCE